MQAFDYLNSITSLGVPWALSPRSQGDNQGLTLFDAPLVSSAPQKSLKYHNKISIRAWNTPVIFTMSTGMPIASWSPHSQMEDIYSPNPWRSGNSSDLGHLSAEHKLLVHPALEMIEQARPCLRGNCNPTRAKPGTLILWRRGSLKVSAYHHTQFI